MDVATESLPSYNALSETGWEAIIPGCFDENPPDAGASHSLRCRLHCHAVHGEDDRTPDEAYFADKTLKNAA
jgi:hypothetical protein